MLDLIGITEKYAPQLTKWAIDQAGKTELIVKFLKERGLLPTEIKDDVDVVYTHALLEYGTSKQEIVTVAILNLLRQNEVKNDFWTAYTNNDPFGFLRKTEEFLNGKIELRDAIKRSNAKLEVELEDFGEIFISIANRTGHGKFQRHPVWDLDPFEKKFKAIIQQKTDLFSGRKFVFDEFRKFLSKNNNGYFIIIGDPGMGKSTIASKYVLAHKCPCYFNSFLDNDNSPAKFLENIRNQLVRRYSLKNADRDDLPTLLQRVSENLLEGQKLIIVVDALDEIDQKEGGNLLGLPEYIPDKVYFLITRTPYNESTKRLNIAHPYEEFDLRDKDKKDLSKNDTQEYIQRYIETNKNNHRDTIRAWIKCQRILELDFVEILSSKSDSNFMYLHHALPAIAKGQYDDLSLSDFPIGLKDYYNRHWQRMNMQDKSKEMEIFVLFVLLKNTESPTVKIITNAIKETNYFPEFEQLDIGRILESWVEFLTKEIIQGEDRYRIYHASFADFLTKTKNELSENRKIFESVIQGISKSTYGKMDELIGL